MVFVFLIFVQRAGEAGVGIIQLGFERFQSAQFADGRGPEQQHHDQQSGQNAGDPPAQLDGIQAMIRLG